MSELAVCVTECRAASPPRACLSVPVPRPVDVLRVAAAVCASCASSGRVEALPRVRLDGQMVHLIHPVGHARADQQLEALRESHGPFAGSPEEGSR